MTKTKKKVRGSKRFETNNFQAQIEEALEGVCGILPSRYAAECNTYVAQYTPMIVDLLIQEVSPKEICATLTLCPASVRWLSS